jgi:hypothetical protein
VPLSLLLILMLLHSLFNSIRDSLLALSGIPIRGGRRHSPVDAVDRKARHGPRGNQ